MRMRVCKVHIVNVRVIVFSRVLITSTPIWLSVITTEWMNTRNKYGKKKSVDDIAPGTESRCRRQQKDDDLFWWQNCVWPQRVRVHTLWDLKTRLRNCLLLSVKWNTTHYNTRIVSFDRLDLT